MQKPSVGRIVLTYVDPTMNGGQYFAPAIITKVHSDTMVNLRVFCDGSSTLHLTSVLLTGTQEDAGQVQRVQGSACWWPPRVG